MRSGDHVLWDACLRSSGLRASRASTPFRVLEQDVHEDGTRTIRRVEFIG